MHALRGLVLLSTMLALETAGCSDDAAVAADSGTMSSGTGSSSSGGSSGARVDGSVGDDASSGGPLPPRDGGASDGGIVFAEVPNFGANPAGLKMYIHAPPRAAANAGVVVLLHGCTQTAEDARLLGWERLADARGFYIVYAEQTRTNNINGCFRWWDPAHTARGAGEPASIAAMEAHVRANFGTTRAFVAGFSAGGATAVVMLATYADQFSAGSSFAGIPYKCANGIAESFSCIGGSTKSAATWGTLVTTALAGASAPRIQVWQGTLDSVVSPTNLGELTKQWSNVHGLSTATTTTMGIATLRRYTSGATVKVESLELQGLGHGVPVDPANGCGKAGAYALNAGLCGASMAADFFGL
jgi:poly(hydroxyalkanoate) depolymerase family esterase